MGNWELIVEENEKNIDSSYSDTNGNIYTFFGIVLGSDDYYYGMSDRENKTLLLSCVCSIEQHGYELLVVSH